MAKKKTEETIQEKTEEKITKTTEKKTSTKKSIKKKNETDKKPKKDVKKITDESNDLQEIKPTKTKLELLKEKAKALEGKVTGQEKKDIKSEVTGEKEQKKDMLVPIEDYLKASIHLGTRVITPHMRKYVYRRRADGLAVFNTDLLDEEIKKGAKYLAQFSPEQFVITCKREAGWHAVKKFAETIGVKIFTKKYPAGTLTNINLSEFFEVDLVFICDPWLDKNILKDANSIKIPVLSICDTNNYTFGINTIIPGNNKSAKSLGMIFYLITKIYIQERGLKIEIPPIQEFVDGWDNLTPPK